MSVGELASQTIHELRDRISAGQVRPEQVIDDVLDRMTSQNPSVHAYLDFDADKLRQQLKAQLATAPEGKLYGIPITIKDNMCVLNEEITCASKILQGYRAPYDATVIERLRREGALIIPKANMDEFAFGSSTENSAFSPTINPRSKPDDRRVPGGSSGGSAAAVAGNLAIAALGSDTGGSIRQPASFCGVVGLKPTYGRVSRYGLVAFASSLDQIGPLSKDAHDAAILLSVIAGHDPRDSTSAPVGVGDYEGALKHPIKGLKVGVPQLSGSEGLEPSVRAALDGAVKQLVSAGAQTMDVTLPYIDKSVATYYIIATAEASSNLARYDGGHYGRREGGNGTSSLLDMFLSSRTQGLGEESKRRILLGTYVLSHGYYDAYYLKGMKVRTLIKQGFDEALTSCDVIAMPTSPTVAFRLGEKLDDPLTMYLSDIYTISANLAGIPAVSIYCGQDEHGLPIGLQLLAKPFDEARLLQVAHAYEQATDWAKIRPTLRTPR